MKLCIQRKDGLIKVQQLVTHRLPQSRNTFRAIKTVKATSKNFADILLWAETVGHTIEEG